MEGIGAEGIGAQEALEILRTPDEGIEDLLDRAEAARREVFGDGVSLCAITNAKSGRCAERCDYCVQSVHFETDAPDFPLKDAASMVVEAERAARAGAGRFSLVTSGRRLSREAEIAVIEEAVRGIADGVGVEVCASVGEVDRSVLDRLRAAGLARLHHNVETAPSFHQRVVHTHTYEDEVRVLHEAREAGLCTCAGGVLGMGESLEQRVEMALALRELAPESVPLNFLDPRPGTPLADLDELTPTDCLRAIAMFRLVMPRMPLIVCGGRERNLAHRQAEMFRAGATGAMVGDYLTTRGRHAGEDRRMIREAGLRLEGGP
jgi:biotin synthase